MCPGSRCAPLSLAFIRYPGFTVRTFSDERSAAFIALGMAQELNNPVVLLCTSGTAAYNFAPAVAEAYFSHIPLVVFTADRPIEWIGQQDGQAIVQKEIFGPHVKKSYTLPQEYGHSDDQWNVNRVVNEAINLSQKELKGPVHINAPFREPFYPASNDHIQFTENVRTITVLPSHHTLSETEKESIRSQWSRYNRIMVIGAQGNPNNNLVDAVAAFSKSNAVPVVGDITTNLHACESLIRHADVILGQASDDVKRSLHPDLLVSFGKSVLSRQTKQFLRAYKPKEHWYIQSDGNFTDTFQSVTKTISTTPEEFFSCLSTVDREESFEGQKQRNYYKLWEIEERRVMRSLGQFFPQQELGEFELVKEVLSALPENINLHLANSMSVRYASFIGLKAEQNSINVFANRGTSGIDGCTSTAVGHALANDRMNVLITGDMAFFYDRNAFWHNYPLPNLRIIVLNNHGGAIFKMIDGPSDLPEADEFFVTRQSLTAKNLCEEFGFEYIKLTTRRQVKNALSDLFDQGSSPKILELETTAMLSKNIFDDFKTHIKKSYEL